MKPELKSIIDSIVLSENFPLDDTDGKMQAAFELAQTPEEKSEAGMYLRETLGKRKRHDVDVRGILGDASEVLNLSYIAKKYFGKDRTWLYQRVNKSTVNGKPAAFTQDELRILSESLSEISHIIQQTSFKLTH